MEEEVFEAELASTNRDTNLLNGLAGATVAVAIVFLMLGMNCSDCANHLFSSEDEDRGVRVPVWERGNLNYVTDQDFGQVMEFGTYDVL